MQNGRIRDALALRPIFNPEGSNFQVMENTSDTEDNEDPVQAENNASAAVIQKISDYQLGEPYSRLCIVLAHATETTLRQTFNSIHPPRVLAERLAKPAIQTVLRRLKVHGLITEQMWAMIYSENATHSSKNYSAALLYILIRNTCSIAPPYPGGWDSDPDEGDQGLGAGVVKLHMMVNTISRLPRQSTDSDLEVYHKEIIQYIKQVCGPGSETLKLLKTLEIMKAKPLSPAEQVVHFEHFQTWQRDLMEIKQSERKIDNLMTQRSGDHDLAKLHRQSTTDRSSRRSSGQQPSNNTSGVDLVRRMNSMGKDVSKTATYRSLEMITSNSDTDFRYLEREVLSKFSKRLSDNIYCDDVVPKLVQARILSHEEKNKLSLPPSNTLKMKMLIDYIGKKAGGFDAFCEAIKHKYKGLYDLLVEAKMKPLTQKKPEESMECADSLRLHYHQKLSKMQPIPWHSHIKKPLSEFYLPLTLTDLRGKPANTKNPFEPHPNAEEPRKVLIEGDYGCGKTTYLQYLLDKWTHKVDSFAELFRMVFYIDFKVIPPGKDLGEAIVDQCLPQNFKKTADDLYNLINANQRKTLLLLDGFENFRGSTSGDFYDILNGKRMKDVCVAMTVSSHQMMDSKLIKHFDTHLALLGLSSEERDRMIVQYASLTKVEPSLFTPLNDEVQWPSANVIQSLTLTPLFCQMLCIIVETNGSIQGIHTETQLLDLFVTAIKRNVCRTHQLKLNPDGTFPQWANDLINALEELAYEHAMMSRTFVYTQAAMEKYNNEELVKCGLLVSHNIGQRPHVTEMCCFLSQALQDYLAARVLVKLVDDDFRRHINKLADDKSLGGITKYCFGLCSSMEPLPGPIPALLEEIQGRNTKCWRGLTFSTTVPSVKTDSNVNSDTRKFEGRLSDFSVTLACLSQCSDNESLTGALSDSLPAKLFMKNKELITNSQIRGLAAAIKHNGPKVTELELRLDPIGYYFMYSMTEFAKAIRHNNHIQTLRVYWISAPLLSYFLSLVFQDKNESIEVLKIYDQTRADTDHVTATVWKGLWAATQGMGNVRVLSFTQCHNPALVAGLLRNLPANLTEVHLNNCTIDKVGAEHLQAVLAHMAVHIVSLQGVSMRRPDFTHICNGIKTTSSVQELYLSQFEMDPRNVVALAEALKLNKTLKVLNISGSSLNSAGARALGVALAMNKTMRQLFINDVVIAEQDMAEIMRSKSESIRIIGYEKK